MMLSNLFPVLMTFTLSLLPPFFTGQADVERS